MTWKSNIVGHDKVDPEQLIANPFNYRMHPQEQRDALAASIRELGFIRSVTVNVQTNQVVDGHERVYQALAMKSCGHDILIDVEYVDLTLEQEALALAVLDPISAMAKHNAEIFDSLRSEIETSDESLQKLLSDIAGDAKTIDSLIEEGKDQSSMISDNYSVLITCNSESEQLELLSEMAERGLQCKALVA